MTNNSSFSVTGAHFVICHAHTQDTRGTTAVENPAAEGGGPAAKVPLLVQQRGGEVGVGSTAIPYLQTTFALWYLASNSELVFDGDRGDTVPTPVSSAAASSLVTIIRRFRG
jgi:hypothetical protein